MLFKINKLSKGYPARLINWVTGGDKGSSLCARMYLYKKYVSNKNILVNAFVFVVDSIEPNHCVIAANHWRRRIKRGYGHYPAKYESWFKQVV